MIASAPASDAAHACKCQLAGELLRSFGTFRLRATGRSMLPTVWPGDTLVIEGIGLDVSEGDIVLFSRNHLFVAHRVVAKLGQPEDPRVLTRGDAMVASDSSLSQHELLGRVSRIQRNGRSVEPNRNLGVAARAVSALVRRSQVAARLLAGVHGIQRASLG